LALFVVNYIWVAATTKVIVEEDVIVRRIAASGLEGGKMGL
jgi:hypothetical protein